MRDLLYNIANHLDNNRATLAEMGYRTGDCLNVALAIKTFLWTLGYRANIILVRWDVWYCHYVVEYDGMYVDGHDTWPTLDDMLDNFWNLWGIDDFDVEDAHEWGNLSVIYELKNFSRQHARRMLRSLVENVQA